MSGEAGTPGAPSAAAVRAVMQGGVARIVFKNAVAALPARLGFRSRFLDVLRRFEYGFVEGLLDQVYDSIQKDFGQVGGAAAEEEGEREGEGEAPVGVGVFG